MAVPHRSSQKVARVYPEQPGLILVDSSYEVVYANAEAVRIFSYPENVGEGGSLRAGLAKSIRSILLGQARSRESVRSRELTSGRRHYVCRSFHVESTGNSNHATMAVLIERNPEEFGDICQFMDQYHLTQRERETVELLMRGMTSKEIAGQMNISPNTVRAFLRLVMIKTGVSTRTGIIGKLCHQVGASANPSSIGRTPN